MREPDQLVGRVAHRREDADDPVAGLAGGDQSPGDLLDLLHVADRRAAELLHQEVDAANRRVGGELRNLFVLADGHGESVPTCRGGPKARGRA